MNLKACQKIIKFFNLKNLSDINQEKIILDDAKNLLFISFKVLLILISIFFYMFILDLLSNSFLKLIFSLKGFVEIGAISFTYYFIRKKIYAKL